MEKSKLVEVICWWVEAFNGGCPHEGTTKCFENCDQFIRSVDMTKGG